MREMYRCKPPSLRQEFSHFVTSTSKIMKNGPTILHRYQCRRDISFPIQTTFAPFKTSKWPLKEMTYWYMLSVPRIQYLDNRDQHPN